VKFLVDAQLPPSLAQWLQGAGYEAGHVEDVGLRNADDGAIRGYAILNGFVLMTKDRDFVAADTTSPEHLQVIWIRTGNISNRILFQRLEAGWSDVVGHLEAGAKIVELR
jgi:predicted nuclease of predicted toxin-antitoxin system